MSMNWVGLAGRSSRRTSNPPTHRGATYAISEIVVIPTILTVVLDFTHLPYLEYVIGQEAGIVPLIHRSG